jgi:hypothetical protein
VRALAAVTAAGALLCAGCGTRATPPSERTWRANAVGLVAQLRADVAAVEQIPPSQESSALYGLLVAYADMGGCSKMVASTGAPPAAVSSMSRACPSLERAAALFTRAESHADSKDLERAAREAQRAQPQLVRAALALKR